MFGKKFCTLVLVTMSLAVSGCGGGPVDEKIALPPSAIEESLRKTLEGFEKSGELGSGISGIEGSIDGIKSSDPAKAETLTKLLNELQGLKKPADIKAKAKEMISKLQPA
ncbi:MAG: hypothetical protein NTU79_06000 [Planctomycetota bacterium]|nr:hypothetical protein [Planctomycetota bacterium]